MIRDAVVCVQTALGGRLVFLHIGGSALERQGAKWDPGLVHSAVRCALGSYIPFQNMDKKKSIPRDSLTQRAAGKNVFVRPKGPCYGALLWPCIVVSQVCTGFLCYLRVLMLPYSWISWDRFPQGRAEQSRCEVQRARREKVRTIGPKTLSGH